MDITEFEQRPFPHGTKDIRKWRLADVRAHRQRVLALHRELGIGRYRQLNRELQQIVGHQTRVYGSVLFHGVVDYLRNRRRKNDV